MMKKYIAPWGVALVSALAIHLLVFALLDNHHWFTPTATDKAVANFEVSLLPATHSPPAGQLGDAFDFRSPPFAEATAADSNASRPLQTHQAQQGATKGKVDISQLQKPEWLDLSKIELSPDADNQGLTEVFSPTLRAQIAASKAAQKAYLKGLVKETHYPITKDADGTRYVNIEGVCWRMPKEGSQEGWAIVFAGCNGQTKSFHFELNIAPSVLLGPDSPFSISK